MKFGMYLRTCAEVSFYPQGILDHSWLRYISQRADTAGFYELSFSDYISTGARIRDPDQAPPNTGSR
jgi:hypothetical protein